MLTCNAVQEAEGMSFTGTGRNGALGLQGQQTRRAQLRVHVAGVAAAEITAPEDVGAGLANTGHTGCKTPLEERAELEHRRVWGKAAAQATLRSEHFRKSARVGVPWSPGQRKDAPSGSLLEEMALPLTSTA
ncbi:hypothetical protein NDU88_007551 [Pleurodeles waltl]|uniref:Uncharacterized protein n=1 Tax=Pleurodeles waltl TaxID=8319 RepID=A0AAV7U030_PLEWA|nr:hypothetical protein NDU88_007551 [Pleurodeles waltl]